MRKWGQAIHDQKRTRPTALIFDVEGTLIDCVPQTLACWHRTLLDFGYAFTEAQLQTCRLQSSRKDQNSQGTRQTLSRRMYRNRCGFRECPPPLRHAAQP